MSGPEREEALEPREDESDLATLDHLDAVLTIVGDLAPQEARRILRAALSWVGA